jgi:peroxiredoxin
MRKFTVLILLILPGLCYSQSTDPIEFSGLNVQSGTEVSLNDFKDKPAVVVLFTGYQCPFDGYYRLRVRELMNSYSDKVAFILVNAYQEPEEAVDKMKMEAVAHGYTVPYLADKEQKIMTALGARKTPEAFLLKRSGDKFVVVYSGAIDDNPQLPSGVKEHYLNAAIEGLLAGKTSTGTVSVRATGCTIRKR